MRGRGRREKMCVFIRYNFVSRVYREEGNGVMGGREGR